MLSGRCAVPDSWTRISRIERIFDSSRRFCFPTRISRISRISTPSEFFPVRHSEYRCLQRKKIREICEIRVRLLFLNHNAKIQHFIFPTHRCSLLLTDTHRLSLINIRVSQMEENIGYLQRIELLAALVVSTLLQLLVELGASYYPSHQMGSCHVRVGIRKIEQG